MLCLNLRARLTLHLLNLM